MGNLAAAALSVVEALDHREAFNADRVFRLLFLADWKATLNQRATITGITWSAEGRADLIGDVPKDDESLVEALQEATGQLQYGDVLELLRERALQAGPLAQGELEIVQFVMRQAGSKDWRQLNSLVFGTRPLLAGRKDKPLNLEWFAEEQRADQRLTTEELSPA